MSQFLESVEKTMELRRLFAAGQSILVAVSGGVDSMVLLHVLHALGAKQRWKIVVAHFNHHLRGNASNADEQLVRQTASRLRLKFVAGGVEVKKLAAQQKISVEMAARKSRHEFLAATACQYKISTIALAHHADDQVELFFLRLLRGSGGEGLGGMKWRSESPVTRKISLVRPLLDVSKDQLLAFATEKKIRFRHDASNASNDFLRNRIRNELLPLLRKEYQRGLDKVVLRLMDIVGAEAEFAGEAAAEFRDRQVKGPKVSSGSGEFKVLPLAVQRKVMQQELASLGLVPDFELIEQLRGESGRLVSVCAGLFAARGKTGKVQIRALPLESFGSASKTVGLSGSKGSVEFAGKTFHWRLGRLKAFRLPVKKLRGGEEHYDADKIGDQITLRHWQPGDRFQPIGRRSSVKLQDLFVNAKVPSARRRQLIVGVARSGTIFWVEGFRIGDEFKLTNATRRKLVWKSSVR